MRGKVFELVDKRFTKVARGLDGVTGTGEEVVVNLDSPCVDGIDGGLGLSNGGSDTLVISNGS